MRTKNILAAVLAVTVWAAPSQADEGGYIDPNGLVWSQTLYDIDGTVTDWKWAQTYAANYSIWDMDEFGEPTLYDDWRIPTVKELQRAVSDGTLNNVLARNPDGTFANMLPGSNHFPSSEAKGNTAYYVTVIVNDSNTQVIGGGEVATWGVKSGKRLGNAIMVRP